MRKWPYHIISVIIVILIFSLISFPLNGWFSFTMPRHQILQLPAMFILGIILAISFSKISIKNTSYGITILIFILSSFIFWMLPRSVDLAIINPGFNRIMHVNMLIAGFLAMTVLRNIIFEAKIFFIGMMAAMLLATGITLRAYNLLLCSSFNIQQQKETGYYLIWIALALFAGTVFLLFKGLSGKENPGLKNL